jgi:subtilisin family serine protease
LLAVFLAMAGLPAVAGAAPTTPSAAQAVTLITGDKVVPAADGPGQLLPAPGRENVRFTSYQTPGHSYVIPEDTMSLLAAKTVDLRLFDVDALRGYHGTLPLIVQYSGTQRTLARTAGAMDLPSINSTAMKADPATFWRGLTGSSLRSNAASALKHSGIARIWLDGQRHATLDHSVPQIGAPTAWAAGYTGTGVTVAVLDTGVDNTHPDLATQEIGEKNFSGSPDDKDHFGHGTHVASIVAGTGAKSGGKYKGVAPGARILDVKVLGDNGSGADSGIIEGMQWAAENGAKVINMSLGGDNGPDIDPIEAAVNTLTAKYGVLFVIAAGNYGPVTGTIDSPGSADAALTVGAVDRDNQIAEFSGRGPRIEGGLIKPDITAPGVDITAALSSTATIGDPAAAGYTKLSGTSMATPHVAGAAALLAQQHPDLTGTQLKALLVGASTPTPGATPFEQGAGRVDSAKVLTQTVTSDPISLSFGQDRWPHTGKAPLTKDVSYRNSGTVPVTLDLKMDVNAGGVLSVSPSRLVIPAGGTAKATVNADVAKAPAGGKFAGAVVAAGGSMSVRTAVEIDLEVESYDVTFTAHDRTGAAPGFATFFLSNLDTGDGVFPDDFVDGKVVQRLAAGQYLLSGSVSTDSTNGYDVISAPNLRISGATTIDLDARTAKPLNVKLPDPSAQLAQLKIGFQRTAGKNRWTITNLERSGYVGDIGFAQLGPDAPAGEATGEVATTWAGDTGFYGLAWYRKGGAQTGLSTVVSARDLATVNVDVGKVADPAYVWLTSMPHNARNEWGYDAPFPIKAGVHKEFFGGDNADWARRVSLPGDNFEDFEGPVKYYAPGHTYAESFYHGVFGPTFTNTRDDLWLQQRGDLMVVATPLFGDGAGYAGFSAVTSASTRLYRNGTLFGQTDQAGAGRFTLPAGKATYRVTTEATRTGHAQATKVSASWTFQGAPKDGVSQYPVSAVRFTPTLDDNGAAPRGFFLLPVSVEDQPGTNSKQRLQSLQVSYDQGATWKAVPVAGGYAALYHPDNARSVSLKATAADRAGNSVEQTIIGAYLLR